MHLESFRAGVKLSRTTSSIEADITFMHTPNTPHSGSEPMLLQGPISRAHARQFKSSSWTQNTVLRSVRPTAITFAYELGLPSFLARWKANEKIHPKVANTSSTSFQCAFGILPAGVPFSRTTCTIDEDITSMRTTNAPHNGSEPVPLQGAIARARARQFL